MYSEVNITDNLISDATKFVMDNDRMLYFNYMKTISEFCSEHKILVGGKLGIDIISGAKLTKDSFVWDLYVSDNAYQFAKALAQKLVLVHSHINPKYIKLDTSIRNVDLTIYINNRTVAKINLIGKYRKINLADLMTPILAKGYFSDKELLCVSGDMQLMEIYRTLYSPTRFQLWKDYLEYSKKLFDDVVATLEENSIKHGSGDADRVNGYNIKTKLIFKKIVKNSLNILIGDHAIGVLTNNKKITEIIGNSRIQIISSDDIESITESVRKLLPGKKIINVKYHLGILYDFRLTKHIIYCVIDGANIPIMDVFNSTSFELVPFIKTGGKLNVNLGNPWVLSRFKLLDLWTIKIISKLTPSAAAGLAHAYQDGIDKLRSLDNFTKNASAHILFPLNDYIGRSESEQVAKKKLIKEKGERIPPYYPYRDLELKAEKTKLDSD